MKLDFLLMFCEVKGDIGVFLENILFMPEFIVLQSFNKTPVSVSYLLMIFTISSSICSSLTALSFG